MKYNFAQNPPPLSRGGIALVTVLVLAVVAISLFTVINLSVVGDLRGGSSVNARNSLVQAADGVSEQARVRLLNDWRTSNMTISNFLSDIRTKVGANTMATLTVTGLANGVEGAWTVKGVSAASANYGWVDVHATVRQNGNTQTVVRRVSFGDPSQFKLAMLSENTNCMYCHLQVNGDVGSLETLRPGWGSEVPTSMHSTGCWVAGEDKCDLGWGSAAGEGETKINGNIFAAKGVTDDDTVLTGGTKKVNGAIVTGNILTNYRGSELPDDTDGDGVPDFPPVRRDVASANANGTITLNASVDNNSFIIGNSGSSPLTGLGTGRLTSISGTYNGNLVLRGSATNPINLDKDLYVTGDVVIEGNITGRGAIYAGRNLYIAGNLVTVNRPDKPGSGVCSSISDPDSCAKKNIEAGKDEVRLAARGSMIIGDYTERDSSNNLLPYDRIQSADYYRNQFGFWSGNRYYDKTTGDEIKLRTSDNKYFNMEGQEIASSNVCTRAADINNTTDAYTYSMRPGKVGSTCGFTSWMSDDFYKNTILGSESYTFNSWRYGMPGKNGGETDRAYRDRLRAELVRARIPYSSTTTTTTVANSTCRGNNNPSGMGCIGNNQQRITVLANRNTPANALACRVANLTGAANNCPDSIIANQGTITNTDNTEWGGYHLDGSTIRVVVRANQSYETQVTRIDAFLYSNWRLAGKTSMKPMAVNGGLIAKDLGILAPGRRKAWWMPAYDSQIRCDGGEAVPDTQDCALTVNYDHRLRNGGYGYNLVQGNPGQTISWRLGDSNAERVTW